MKHRTEGKKIGPQDAACPYFAHAFEYDTLP